MRVWGKDERPFILRLVSALGTLACVAALSLPADALTANTAASFLAIGSGSRPIALGGAYVAVSNDSFALSYNPAGLNRLRGGTLAFQHNEWGLDMRQEILCGTLPTGAGMLGIGVTYVSYGAIAGRDSLGNLSGASFSPADSALTAGYGFGEVLPGLAAGATLNLYNEELAGSNALGVASNLGALYRLGDTGVDLGLALYNIGTPLAGYSLPAQVAFGAAGRLFGDVLLISLEGDVPLSASPLELKAGLEGTFFNLLALRAGYSLTPDEGAHALHGLTAGLGFTIAAGTLSYAYQPFGSVAQAHRLTLEYSFAPPAAVRIRKSVAPAPAVPAKPAVIPTPAPEMGLLKPKEPVPLQPAAPNLAARPVVLTQEEKKNAVRAFLRGRDYYDQRQYDLAIVEFDKALAVYPDFAKARRYLSWAKRDRARLMLAGSFRASAQRDTALEANKLYQQGLELEKRGKPVDAAFSYKSALLLIPEYEEARQGLKRVQAVTRKSGPADVPAAAESQKDNTAASIIKSSAAGRKPAPEGVLTNLPAHHPVKAESAETEESLSKAIQKHLLAGTQALDQGDFAQAQREFELVLEFEPENKQAQYKLSQAKAKAAEQMEETKAKAKEAQASGDRLGEVNALRDLVMLNPNDAAARQAFNEAKKKSKQQIDELYKKGVTAYAQGSYSDAIQIWNEVLDLDPEHEKAKSSIKKAREKLELTNE
jgi:tetratricopeptide (TPR) repeat protein